MTSIDRWTTVTLRPQRGHLLVDLADLGVVAGLHGSDIRARLSAGSREPPTEFTVVAGAAGTLRAVWDMLYETLGCGDPS